MNNDIEPLPIYPMPEFFIKLQEEYLETLGFDVAKWKGDDE